MRPAVAAGGREGGQAVGEGRNVGKAGEKDEHRAVIVGARLGVDVGHELLDEVQIHHHLVQAGHVGGDEWGVGGKVGRVEKAVERRPVARVVAPPRRHRRRPPARRLFQALAIE